MEHHHLPVLVVQLPYGTAVLLRRQEFPTRFCSKELQQCEYSPAERLGKGSGLKRQVKYRSGPRVRL